MQNKLQELTDKLYNEGLSKGKQEAQEMVAKAKAEAEKILATAQENANKIIADAEKQALDIKTKADNDLRIAASQTISAVKQQIENIIITKALKEPVKASLSDVDFVKSVILTIAKAFNASSILHFAKDSPTRLDIALISVTLSPNVSARANIAAPSIFSISAPHPSPPQCTVAELTLRSVVEHRL